MDDHNFIISWCPACNQGWVKIVKDEKTNVLFLCCAECGTEWVSPADINVKSGTRGSFGQITNPSIEEIEKLQWERYIKKSE